MACDEHNANDREVTVSLIEFGEISKYINVSKKPKVANSEWSDAVIGWKTPGGFDKPSNTGTNVKKKRTVERSMTDINAYVNSYSIPVDEYWSTNTDLADPNPVVRCVDDAETYPIPPWKSNIEQGTYRYIPDNGSYRTLKFMYDERREWYTIRKKYPEKVSTTWNQNCKRMQREMRRQLKKDISRAEREQKETSGYTSSGRNSVNEPTSGGETTRASSGMLGTLESKSDRGTPVTGEKIHAHVKPKYRPETEPDKKSTSSDNSGRQKKEVRVKSTHSDGALNNVRKMRTIHERESEPVTPMPHYSIPSGSQMLKSASDLFIENFSSRISALEDEIKRDSKWLRKNENDLTKLQNSRAKHREHTRAALKESGAASQTPRDRLQSMKTETLGCDIFSVKPMAQKELKPLEKTKGYTNKPSNHSAGEINDSSPSIQSKHIYIAPSPSTNGHNSELDNASSAYKTFIENGKPVMFNTLTGTKINTQSHKKSSKGFSTPSTITICDNNPGSPHGGTRTIRNVESYRPVPVVLDKTSDRRESLQQNIPALLPEISGKRLEMTSVSHRLL